MNVAVCGKIKLFTIWKESRNEEDTKKYCEAKTNAKRVPYMTMDQKKA